MLKKLLIILFITAFLFQGAASLDAAVDAKTAKKVSKLMVKGNKAFNKKNLEKAYKYFSEALKLDPSYAQANFAVGNLFYAKKQFMKALEMYKKTVELDKNYAKGVSAYSRLLFQKAISHLRKKETAKGNADFKTLAGIHGLENVEPKIYTDACYNVGVNAYNNKNFDESVMYLEKLIGIKDVKTKSLKLHNSSIYLLGMNFTQLKKTDKGNEYFKQYVKLTSEDPKDPYAPVALYLVTKSDFDKLNKRVDAVKKADEEESKKKKKNRRKKKKGPGLRDKIAAEAKKDLHILKDLQKIVKLKADFEDAYLMLGNMYYLLNNLEKSAETYNHLVVNFPSSENGASYKAFLADLKKEMSDKAKKKKRK